MAFHGSVARDIVRLQGIAPDVPPLKQQFGQWATAKVDQSLPWPLDGGLQGGASGPDSGNAINQ